MTAMAIASLVDEGIVDWDTPIIDIYPDFELAGDIPDEICAGDTISLSAVVSNIDSTYEVSVSPTEGGFPTGGIRSDSLPLPDGTGATYSTSIVFDNFSLPTVCKIKIYPW